MSITYNTEIPAFKMIKRYMKFADLEKFEGFTIDVIEIMPRTTLAELNIILMTKHNFDMVKFKEYYSQIEKFDDI